MKVEDAPQDKSTTYHGHQRLLYAQRDDEHYTTVHSSGWATEETATIDAVNEYQRLAAESLAAYRRGEQSPLAYHMYDQRMDLPLLASVTGQFRWQVKRHFKPRVFARLSLSRLERYASVMGICIDRLTMKNT